MLENFNSIPESISHRKLNKLMFNAQKEAIFAKPNHIEDSDECNNLKQLFISWEKVSIDVLKKLNDYDLESSEYKHTRSLMALGAMQAHINMAIQALKASEKDN